LKAECYWLSSSFYSNERISLVYYDDEVITDDYHYGLHAQQSDNQHLHLAVLIRFCDSHYILCLEYSEYLSLWNTSPVYLRLLAVNMIENQISRGWKRNILVIKFRNEISNDNQERKSMITPLRHDWLIHVFRLTLNQFPGCIAKDRSDPFVGLLSLSKTSQKFIPRHSDRFTINYRWRITSRWQRWPISDLINLIMINSSIYE